MVPLLSIIVGLPIHQAIALSLISIVGVSTSSLSNYIYEGNVDFKVGSVLELATVLGAIGGANLALILKPKFLFIIFGLVLIYVSIAMFKGVNKEIGAGVKTSYSRLKLLKTMLVSFIAGVLAGLLGIGGGILKVPIMTLYLGMPIKIAIGTSEYMISITSTASSYVYLNAGKVYMAYLGPAFISSILGAQIGSRLSIKTSPEILRRIFAVLMFVFALTMIWKGWLT